MDSSYQTHGFKDLDAPTRSIVPSECPVNRHRAPPNKGGNQGLRVKRDGDVGLVDLGLEDMGRGDAETRGPGTRGRREAETRDARM